ncbi:MAG: hypothetical protein HKN88_05515 [Gammaproteobacteria bacterium]|nr:hypothetical protein [Gammaproteobacteria bacterium]NNC97512.1 hypothetical protein [Gammaproteobacteria bacterium]NNM14228.1 hypothetical protein [Gammaproteobacteria bacterium]
MKFSDAKILGYWPFGFQGLFDKKFQVSIFFERVNKNRDLDQQAKSPDGLIAKIAE